ncbi:MAG: hypothetical protein IJ093_02900 [Bacilli bacterium]|nr:hypothetical protein [Bacilli bacterium]
MDTMRDMAFMAAGSDSMYLFMKYKKPITKTIQDTLDKESKMVNNMLEDMM